MGFLGETFDLADMPVAEKRSFDPIPAGWYTACIAGAEVKTTKAGTGKYISVRFDISGPEHQGRVVFTNLNTNNPSPKAEEIGRGQLGDIMRTNGIAKLENTDQLLGCNLKIRVTVKDDPTYGLGNEVKEFGAIDGSSPPVASAAPPWASS